MQAPLISIVTISYNCADSIERTIRSVLSQQYSRCEYIIVDGGSTDGTVEIIRKYQEHLAWWVSEKDRGISDAFNKGIAAAKGTYINLLNAGDCYVSPNTLAEVEPWLQSPLVTFRFTEENSGDVSRLAPENEVDVEKKALLGHQATFVQKKVYDAFGGYQTSYKIRMDFDFFLRVLPHCALKAVDLIIVRYNAGLSGSLRHRFRYETEGLVSVFLNGRRPNHYLFRLFYQPIWRVLIYSLKQNIKSVLRRGQQQTGVNPGAAFKRANP